MHLLRVQVAKVDWRVLVLHVQQLVLQSESVIKRRDRLSSSLAWELLRVHLVQEVAELCAHVAFVPERVRTHRRAVVPKLLAKHYFLLVQAIVPRQHVMAACCHWAQASQQQLVVGRHHV